jgi:hypothetical protein
VLSRPNVRGLQAPVSVVSNSDGSSGPFPAFAGPFALLAVDGGDYCGIQLCVTWLVMRFESCSASGLVVC